MEAGTRQAWPPPLGGGEGPSPQELERIPGRGDQVWSGKTLEEEAAASEGLQVGVGAGRAGPRPRLWGAGQRVSEGGVGGSGDSGERQSPEDPQVLASQGVRGPTEAPCPDATRLGPVSFRGILTPPLHGACSPSVRNPGPGPGLSSGAPWPPARLPEVAVSRRLVGPGSALTCGAAPARVSTPFRSSPSYLLHLAGL